MKFKSRIKSNRKYIIANAPIFTLIHLRRLHEALAGIVYKATFGLRDVTERVEALGTNSFRLRKGKNSHSQQARKSPDPRPEISAW